MGIIPEPFSSLITGSLSLLSADMQSRDGMELLFNSLGYEITLTDEQYTAITALGQIDTVTVLLDNLDTAATAGEATADLINIAMTLIEAIESLATINVSDIATLPEPLDSPDFWADLALALPGNLLVRYLSIVGPTPLALLRVAGVITDVPVNPADPDSPTHPVLDWAVLVDFFQNPPATIAARYQWGAEFQYQALLENVAILCAALGMGGHFGRVPDHLRDSYFAPDKMPLDLVQLELPFFEGWHGTQSSLIWLKAGLLLLPVPRQPDAAVSGVYIANLLDGGAAAGVELTDTLFLDASGSADASGAMGLIIQPGDTPVFDGTAPAVDFSLGLHYVPDAPLILIGQTDSGRLELAGMSLTLALTGSVNDPEIILRISTIDDGLKAIIAPGEGDPFVKEILGENPLSVGADIELEWSSHTGFRFSGGAELDLTIPLHLTIFVVTIHELHLVLRVDGHEGIEGQVDIDASALLGPFTLTVADVGVHVIASPSKAASTSGTFGGLSIDWAFKPPGGVGMAFNFLDLVYGGGFIDYEPETGEYSGIITVEMMAIGVTATAIITTRPPDNPDGWSLFVSINVDLGSLPLGFGFTLEKVGGLVGVHRAIDVDVFQAGIRTGILDSILFPDDPIADAPRILSDIEAAFPTAHGSFVFGAMLQIGWGTPTIITGSLGLIVQVPDIIIALIGQAETILPFDEEALIEVHFDVVGILDLTAGTLSIDAGLRDSQIVGFVLTGQMALRASFLTEPSLLLSMGGFHPAFAPPENFPTLDRMGFGISVGDWLSISLEAYLALTSNTVQFGARLYMYAELVGFRVEGGTEINALIQFKPFQFRSDLSYYISVSAASVELMGVLLTGSISGPNPYFVRGQARFKLLGLEQEVNIEETIGNKNAIDNTDDVPVLNEVAIAFENPENWHAVDDGERIGAVLLAETNRDDDVTLHPGGTVEVVQHVAPLDVKLEHYGNADISGEDTLDVGNVEAGSANLSWEFVEDWFAPAQFFEMSQDTKLSSPSFEKMKGGIRLGDDQAECGASADTVYDYKQMLRDPEFEVSRLYTKRTFVPDASILTSLGAQVVTQRTPKTVTDAKPSQIYELNPARYTTVERETLTSTPGMLAYDMTFAEAEQHTRLHAGARATDQIVVTSGERQNS